MDSAPSCFGGEQLEHGVDYTVYNGPKSSGGAHYTQAGGLGKKMDLLVFIN